MNIYILDTNILLADPMFSLTYLFSKIDDYKILIIKSILDELDSLKIKNDVSGYKAREASRGLENFLANSKKVENGWEISPGCFIDIDEEIELKLPKNMHQKTCDDRLLAATAKYTESHKEGTIWLTSLDRNMLVRAEALNLNWIDPASWFPIDTNTYHIPFADFGFRWTQTGNNSVRLPMDLENNRNNWVDVWPYWGYPSGDYSTLHIRFFDQSHGTENIEESASRLLILSSEKKIRYRSKLNNIPYLIVHPQDGQTYSMIHKKWKIEVSINRVEITENINDQSNLKNIGLGEILLGVSNVGQSSVMKGLLIGSGINKISAVARYSPIFTQLGFTINVSKATDEELDKDRQLLKTESKDKQTKRRQNIVIMLIVLAVVIGIPVLIATLCIISTIISSG